MNGDRISAVGALPGQGALVLVADGYPDAQWEYGVRLRRAGFRVAFASSGEEALAQARLLRPDAVIIDLALRGTDGWTAIRDIRSDIRLDDVRILALSERAEPRHERFAYECGCDLFVTKTCPVETLLSVLHGLLAKPEGVFASGARMRTADVHPHLEPPEVPARSTG
jgi:two-component system OmpR family response regulator